MYKTVTAVAIPTASKAGLLHDTTRTSHKAYKLATTVIHVEHMKGNILLSSWVADYSTIVRAVKDQDPTLVDRLGHRVFIRLLKDVYKDARNALANQGHIPLGIACRESAYSYIVPNDCIRDLHLDGVGPSSFLDTSSGARWLFLPPRRLVRRVQRGEMEVREAVLRWDRVTERQAKRYLYKYRKFRAKHFVVNRSGVWFISRVHLCVRVIPAVQGNISGSTRLQRGDQTLSRAVVAAGGEGITIGEDHVLSTARKVLRGGISLAKNTKAWLHLRDLLDPTRTRLITVEG